MKKFVALILALGMMLSLAACGSGSSAQSSSSQPGSASGSGSSASGLSLLSDADRAKEFITVATGPTSGIYYPIGGAFATALSDWGYRPAPKPPTPPAPTSS